MNNVIEILFAAFIFNFSLFAQISPGELSNAHANFEGMHHCTNCHQLGEKVLNSKCLECHKEIKFLINANRGYHASSDVAKKACASCHNEHHGRKFKIINFNQDKFDHHKAGFALTGAHAKKVCKDCHQSKFISDNNLRKRKNTFLGLNQNCISCHEDFHQSAMGENCSNCHSTEKFKPASSFDHNKAAFKLTGKHEKVECEKCHPAVKKNGENFTKYKGLKFSNCSPCHSDFHKGAFGADCKSCHSFGGFNIINQKAFDHNKTKFALIGKHQNVLCNDCHKGANKSKPLFSKCTDCHSDYHKGSFTKNNTVTDCKICHSESGFLPSNFTIEDHNKIKFKIDGSHLAVACKQCHYQNSNWKFKELGTLCKDCHDNIHGDEISEKYLQNDECQSCHITENWKKVSFDHYNTEFKLLGKHQTVTCAKCHYKEVSGKKQFLFVSLDLKCEQCHKDVHFNQFNFDGETNCLKCHSYSNWKPEKFDHTKTNFVLGGAHDKLQCPQCHKKNIVNENSFVLYKIKNFKCADCHSK
jgi:hypothetical protein